MGRKEWAVSHHFCRSRQLGERFGVHLERKVLDIGERRQDDARVGPAQRALLQEADEHPRSLRDVHRPQGQEPGHGKCRQHAQSLVHEMNLMRMNEVRKNSKISLEEINFNIEI